jgi:hypothetical protein
MSYANEMGVTVFIRCASCSRTCCARAPLGPGELSGEMVVRTEDLEPPSDWRSIVVEAPAPPYRGLARTELLCGVCSGDGRARSGLGGE